MKRETLRVPIWSLKWSPKPIRVRTRQEWCVGVLSVGGFLGEGFTPKKPEQILCDKESALQYPSLGWLDAAS